MYFCCERCCVLLCSEGAFSVPIDRDYSSRAWHLELEVCLVRFKLYFRRSVIVPLPLCPWYFKSVVMYAKRWFRYIVRARVGAALLR